jgi:nucleotide-binding universal stress UspA family protein
MGAPRYVDQPQHTWPAWEREIVDRLCTLCAQCPPDVPVRAYLRNGEVAGEIVRFAAERQHDAIVLVRRSRFERGRAPVLRAVLAAAPCPVLLLGAPPG